MGSTADDLSNDIANDGDDPAVLLLAMANQFAYGQTTGDYKENDLRVLSPCERCGAQLPTALSRATNLPLNDNGLRNLIWKGFVAVCPTCAACCLHNDDKNKLHTSVVRALEDNIAATGTTSDAINRDLRAVFYPADVGATTVDGMMDNLPTNHWTINLLDKLGYRFSYVIREGDIGEILTASPYAMFMVATAHFFIAMADFLPPTTKSRVTRWATRHAKEFRDDTFDVERPPEYEAAPRVMAIRTALGRVHFDGEFDTLWEVVFDAAVKAQPLTKVTSKDRFNLCNVFGQYQMRTSAIENLRRDDHITDAEADRARVELTTTLLAAIAPPFRMPLSMGLVDAKHRVSIDGDGTVLVSLTPVEWVTRIAFDHVWLPYPEETMVNWCASVSSSGHATGVTPFSCVARPGDSFKTFRSDKHYNRDVQWASTSAIEGVRSRVSSEGRAVGDRQLRKAIRAAAYACKTAAAAARHAARFAVQEEQNAQLAGRTISSPPRARLVAAPTLSPKKGTGRARAASNGWAVLDNDSDSDGGTSSGDGDLSMHNKDAAFLASLSPIAVKATPVKPKPPLTIPRHVARVASEAQYNALTALVSQPRSTTSDNKFAELIEKIETETAKGPAQDKADAIMDTPKPTPADEPIDSSLPDNWLHFVLSTEVRCLRDLPKSLRKVAGSRDSKLMLHLILKANDKSKSKRHRSRSRTAVKKMVESFRVKVVAQAKTVSRKKKKTHKKKAACACGNESECKCDKEHESKMDVDSEDAKPTKRARERGPHSSDDSDASGSSRSLGSDASSDQGCRSAVRRERLRKAKLKQKRKRARRKERRRKERDAAAAAAAAAEKKAAAEKAKKKKEKNKNKNNGKRRQDDALSTANTDEEDNTDTESESDTTETDPTTASPSETSNTDSYTSDPDSGDGVDRQPDPEPSPLKAVGDPRELSYKDLMDAGKTKGGTNYVPRDNDAFESRRAMSKMLELPMRPAFEDEVPSPAIQREIESGTFEHCELNQITFLMGNSADGSTGGIRRQRENLIAPQVLCKKTFKYIASQAEERCTLMITNMDLELQILNKEGAGTARVQRASAKLRHYCAMRVAWSKFSTDILRRWNRLYNPRLSSNEKLTGNTELSNYVNWVLRILIRDHIFYARFDRSLFRDTKDQPTPQPRLTQLQDRVGKWATNSLINYADPQSRRNRNRNNRNNRNGDNDTGGADTGEGKRERCPHPKVATLFAGTCFRCGSKDHMTPTCTYPKDEADMSEAQKRVYRAVCKKRDAAKEKRDAWFRNRKK